MPKKRIFQVAKDLNISHLDIIKFLKGKGIDVASVNSPLEDDVYETILAEFNKERLEIERLRKEKARQAIINEKEKEKELEVEKSEPVKEEKVGLKIIKRPEEVKEEKPSIPEVKLKKISTPDNSKPLNIDLDIKPKDKKPSKKNLKQIDISAIAEKINKGKKDTKNNTVDKSVLNKTISGQAKKKKKRKKVIEENVEELETTKVIKIPEFSSVDELAQSMNVKSQDVIMSCMGLGLMVTINQRLDMDTITMVADEYGFEVETLKEFAEEESDLVDTEEDIKNATERAPVVTIMGHVDPVSYTHLTLPTTPYV